MDKPIGDHWAYHAVAAVVLGHSLIRSFPEVDASRIGVTGISWGGYLTCIVAGVDDRFRFAAPVYGCGFLGEGSAGSAAGGQGTEKAMRTQHAVGPLTVPRLRSMPLFLQWHQRPFLLPPHDEKAPAITRDRQSLYKTRMPSRPPPSVTRRNHAFADAVLQRRPALARFTSFSHAPACPSQVAALPNRQPEISYTATNTGSGKAPVAEHTIAITKITPPE
jgi:dienelactone hydrolase